MIKLKSLKFILIAIVAIVFASCFDKVNDDEVSYTPEREVKLISEYLDTMINRGLDVDTTDLGVYVIELEEGDGEYVLPGDSIGINYTGYFLSGGVFDASPSEYKFRYKEINFIDGFDDAIAQLNVGAKGYFLIPSSLAYGSTGFSVIPPYTPLLFELELVGIYNE